MTKERAPEISIGFIKNDDTLQVIIRRKTEKKTEKRENILK